MKDTQPFKMSPSAQKIIDRKLKEANDYLATVDIKKYFEEEAKRKKEAKS
ncbi:hypothetical protein ACWKW6_03875 [Dyadobacter jiangsuensis]